MVAKGLVAKNVKAKLVAKGYQNPVPQAGIVDTSGCVSLRSPHLQVISLRDEKKGKLWSLDIYNAFSQADGFTRDVCLQAPLERVPLCNHGAWNLKAPATGFIGARNKVLC